MAEREERRVRVTRRQVLASTLTVGTAAVLAACGQLPSGAAAAAQKVAEAAPKPAEKAAVAPGQKITLKFFAALTNDQAERFDQVIGKAVGEAFPNITFQLQRQPGGEARMRETLAVLIAGGLPPDVWEYATPASVMAKNGWLIPIDTYIARDKYDLSVFNPRLLEFHTTWEGRRYQLPYRYSGNTFVYGLNKAHFDEAGISIPSTMSGLPPCRN
jgi:ABC-type glycerol-3-phosphate transport system substrate-binding protein